MSGAVVNAVDPEPAAAPAGPGEADGTWRRLRRHRGAVVGMVIVGLYAAVALLANVLAPYDPTDGDVLARLQPPSAQHLLGTDELGRDILSRLVVGARTSLVIQVTAAALAMVVGVVWGLGAGYFGGWVDEISMRAIDVLLAFPSILLAIAIVAIVGTGLENIIVAVGIASVPQFARLVRGVVLDLRHAEFVEAARAIGEPDASIMFRYIMPGTLAPVIVLTSLRMATVLLAAAGLNFLGLGVQPPTPEWGAMLSNARDYMFAAPFVTTFPGLAITLVVIGFNLLGDGLRDALDPRMRD
ncbi:MAG TPA: ABC transporter permease [bacterium]|nr:ABC transporter permease [bacterium]